MKAARPALGALELAEDPDAWAALGFAVDDGRCVVGATELRLRGGEGGITGWALDGADGAADGLAVAPPAAQEGRPRAAHPNGVVAVDHVVVGTPDLRRTVAALEAVGLECRATRDAGSPERPLRQAFLPLADALVEVVGPREPDGDGGLATFWGLTLVVEDLDACAALLGDRLGRVKDAVQPGRRIATVRREAGLRTPVAFMTPRAPRRA